MFNLNRKIEEIRRQPEHIRLRYVYAVMFLSMFFILLIWIVSIKSMFQETPSDNQKNSFSSLKESFKENFSEEKKDVSLQEILEENDQKIQEEFEKQKKATSSEEFAPTSDSSAKNSEQTADAPSQ